MTGNYDKVIVVGDVHGDLNQFIYPLIYFMNDIDNSKIIYLGDYIDRGESNVYIYEILNALNNIPEFKNKIIFLRGNHESFDSGIMMKIISYYIHILLRLKIWNMYYH